MGIAHRVARRLGDDIHHMYPNTGEPVVVYPRQSVRGRSEYARSMRAAIVPEEC